MKYVPVESNAFNSRGGIRASASGTRPIPRRDAHEPSTVEPPCSPTPTAPHHDVHSAWLERHEDELADLQGLEAWIASRRRGGRFAE